ncbi:MAG: TonB-dependent receptor [Rhodanobacteraceae bacterium]|nr:TonB-dependent receptor [Rhodanobacteraceae bacterium]
MIRLRVFGLALAVAGSALAEKGATSSDEAEQQALLQLLAEETEVATRTRENADFVPGIVSVLSAEEARALGARSVLDAIALLPGIEVNRDPNGAATLRVRGIDAFFNSGNVKILVNGLDTSYPVAAQNSATLLMPLNIVDRIEVIRGPGSVVFGDFALNGLVNIVTHAGRDTAFAGVGAGGERLVGGSLSGEGGDWKWQFDLTRETSQRYDAPGRGEADETRNYGALRVARGGFALKAAGLVRDQRRLVVAAGSPIPTLRTPKEHTKALEARYDWRFADDDRIGLWTRYSDADYAGGQFFVADRREMGSDANWRFDRHHLLAEIAFGVLDVDYATLPVVALPPNLPPPAGRRPASVGTKLSSHSLLLQDQFDWSEQLSLTAGLRYDRFADVTTRITPRIGGVWRASDANTIKAQYGEGFRTPIMTELYDSGTRNTQLDFESVSTSELTWIHRRQDSLWRATVYHALVNDYLGPAGPPGAGFRNRGYLSSRGIELEASMRLGDAWRVTANLTRIKTSLQTPTPISATPPKQTIFGTPDVLANLGVIYQPSEQWTLGTNWNRVGARAVPPQKVRGYSTLNLSAERHFVAVPGLSLRLALRNANSAQVTYVLNRPIPNPPLILDYGARAWSIELGWQR